MPPEPSAVPDAHRCQPPPQPDRGIQAAEPPETPGRFTLVPYRSGEHRDKAFPRHRSEAPPVLSTRPARNPLLKDT